MKLEIDTKEDSQEAIKAAVQMLQAHLRSQGVSAPMTNFQQSSYDQYNSYSSPTSYEDRLAKKIAKAKAREENYASEPVTMSMFDTPPTNPVEDKDDDDAEEGYQILTY